MNNWIKDAYNFLKKQCKSKWFPTILLLLISIMIYILTYSSHTIDNIDWNKKVLDAINNIALTFIAGGAFTVFIKFFQFSGIFKEELKSVICDEDLYVENSKKENSNLFINKLKIYSNEYISEAFEMILDRIFYQAYEKKIEKLDTNLKNKVGNRLKSELKIFTDNNYIQKGLVLEYTIRSYNEDFILLEQEITADIIGIEDTIMVKRSYDNWVPSEKFSKNHNYIDIEYFKFGGIDYSNQFITESVYSGKKKKKEGDLKIKKSINLEIKDVGKTKMKIKINFLLSLDSFLYWNYKFIVYTKKVKVFVNYENSTFQAIIMEFAQNEKFKSYSGKIIHKENDEAIYVPQDSFMLAIHKKRS